MPAYLSYLLQLLDVGCFALLKKVYRKEVEDLIYNYINYITKLEFLPTFKAAFQNAITKNNICSSFRGTGLVLYNPEAVISKLEIRPRTPILSIEEETPWEPKIPSNPAELAFQTELIKSKVARHQNSSLIPINNTVDQFLKGAYQMVYQLTLLKAENTALQKANKAVSRQKKRQKKRVQKQGTLTVTKQQLGLRCLLPFATCTKRLQCSECSEYA
jgi:hypothetical protein